MHHVIDTKTNGIAGRWTCPTKARQQARALNRAYGAIRYTTRPLRSAQ
ncbi:hypothetical protein [Luteibacter sp. 22Crub2.1]|nr:hypothetical protein [Luteibacter sp. 22Crub2.1]SKB50891.1 hypothetical protein SAMN05660880_01384 [Luteibacter sp. 22Crub2.1]